MEWEEGRREPPLFILWRGLDLWLGFVGSENVGVLLWVRECWSVFYSEIVFSLLNPALCGNVSHLCV
jgi:hypothetical protein